MSPNSRNKPGKGKGRARLSYASDFERPKRTWPDATVPLSLRRGTNRLVGCGGKDDHWNNWRNGGLHLLAE
jgi:hypothetical protein